MNFLQPAMLLALPIIALPVVIHLINQRRFRTIRWGAMMFLLAANRMSRGYARIRQWLILAARTLAIAGLIFAISRPLASGWMSLAAGSSVDTTIVLLDRSPSMLEQGVGGRSKLETGREQLIQSLGTIGSNRWILIDSVTNAPIEFESAASLADLLEAEEVSASSDLPAMLQSAHEYIRENRPSRAEIWICSDIRRNDWDADSGRWQAIRDSFLQLNQDVRIHLLAYADTAPENRSIRITDVRRVESASGAELLLSLRIEQAAAAEGTIAIPLQIELEDARSEITVELSGSEFELKDHSVPLDALQTRGWGKVSIPADANPADNEFFFVFDQAPARKTVVVADEADAVHPLALAASISPDPAVTTTVETVAPRDLAGVAWEQVALLLWQSALPAGEDAAIVQNLIDRGGQAVFFPPQNPTDTSFTGIRWEAWEELPAETQVATWVGDQDLLANARSGASLPVGQLKVKRYCKLTGDHTSLASLQSGAPLLARAVTDQRNVYFCATTTSEDSTLARDGVVLYVMVQRALQAGASSLAAARQLVAGDPAFTTAAAAGSTSSLQRLSSTNTDAPSTSYGVQAGVYQLANRLIAVNRSTAEDRPVVVDEARVAGLFDGLRFDRVDDRAGSGTPLVNEIWRLFLALMMAALFAEACLCLPRLGAKPAAAPASLHGAAA